MAATRQSSAFARRVVTVTANPAIDKTIVVRNFQLNAVNKVERTHIDIGGKGINVSKCIASLASGEVVASSSATPSSSSSSTSSSSASSSSSTSPPLLPLSAALDSTPSKQVVKRLVPPSFSPPTKVHAIVAGYTGSMVARFLTSSSIPHSLISLSNPDLVTRTNIKMIDPNGKTFTDINEPGPHVDAPYVSQLKESIFVSLSPSDILVMSGSLPPGVDPCVYREMVETAHNTGAVTILDCDGAPLLQGVKASPFLIKPNKTELARLVQAVKDAQSKGEKSGKEKEKRAEVASVNEKEKEKQKEHVCGVCAHCASLSDVTVSMTSPSSASSSSSSSCSSSAAASASASASASSCTTSDSLRSVIVNCYLISRLFRIPHVVCSLGSEGLVHVSRARQSPNGKPVSVTATVWPALPVRVCSTVGAGDAVVAGIAWWLCHMVNSDTAKRLENQSRARKLSSAHGRQSTQAELQASDIVEDTQESNTNIIGTNSTNTSIPIGSSPSSKAQSSSSSSVSPISSRQTVPSVMSVQEEDDMIRWGVATASAKVCVEGSQPPDREEVVRLLARVTSRVVTVTLCEACERACTCTWGLSNSEKQ